MSNEPSKGIKTNSGKSTGLWARIKSRGLESQAFLYCLWNPGQDLQELRLWAPHWQFGGNSTCPLPSHGLVQKIKWENGCEEFLIKLQILYKYKGLLFLDSIDFLNSKKPCVAGWSSYVINNQEKCSGSWNNFTSLLTPRKGHWL